MRTIKLNLKSTFFSLLGYSTPLPEAQQSDQLEKLRALMLASLGDAGNIAHIRLARKLRFSDDAQGLWYARSELMAALSAMHGETRARQEMDQLTAQFQGLLPKGLYSGHGRTPG